MCTTTVQHVNKSVRILAPGESEATRPNVMPPDSQPKSQGGLTAWTGTVYERPMPDSHQYLQSTMPATTPASTPHSMIPPFTSPTAASGLSNPSSFAYGSVPNAAQASSPIPISSSPPAGLQSYNQELARALSNSPDSVVSLTILGGGTGPAHTIPIQSAYGKQSPTSDTVPSTASVPQQEHRSTSATTHKRAFADSPVAERVSPSQVERPPAAPERPSVLGTAFSGSIVERDPFAPSETEEVSLQDCN